MDDQGRRDYSADDLAQEGAWATPVDVRSALYKGEAVYLNSRKVRLHGQRGTLLLPASNFVMDGKVRRFPRVLFVNRDSRNGTTYIVHLADLDHIKDGWGAETSTRRLTRWAIIASIVMNAFYLVALLRGCA